MFITPGRLERPLGEVLSNLCCCCCCEESSAELLLLAMGRVSRSTTSVLMYSLAELILGLILLICVVQRKLQSTVQCRGTGADRQHTFGVKVQSRSS